jgi:hypothetical protein
MIEVDLWEKYRRILLERERLVSNPQMAGQIIAEAVRLAKLGLNAEDRTFILDYPPSVIQNRLISWEIIVQEEGRTFRFRHEKLQDYLYAWDATERNIMPSDVRNEIDVLKTRNVLVWMNKLYANRGSKLHAQFVKEMLNDK